MGIFVCPSFSLYLFRAVFEWSNIAKKIYIGIVFGIVMRFRHHLENDLFFKDC